jgi:hypothetical protein
MDQVALDNANPTMKDADAGPAVASVAGPALRPALFARYGDLSKLRYDFPLVLVDDEGGGRFLQSLTSVVDGILREVALPGAAAEPLRRQVLRLEGEIRARVSRGESDTLSALWKRAAAELIAESGESVFGPLATNLDRARDALTVDGAVIDCDADTPHRVLAHAWTAVQAGKAKVFRKKVDGLIMYLSDILKADFMRSDKAHTPEALQSAIGTSFESAFDFEAMSRVLSIGSSEDRLSEDRRRRIRAVLQVLQSQRFYGPGRASERKADQPEPHSFVFDGCAAALDAFRDRLPEMLDCVKALTIAELEIQNRYRAGLHDPVFARFDESDLSEDQLALFPSYLVCLRDGYTDPAETLRAFETLASGLPVKVLVQTDDILGKTTPEPPRSSFGAGSARLAAMAVGLNDTYVFQTPNANLCRAHDRLVTGLRYDGPALFAVYSGATPGGAGVPPYLLSAAATESCAFPTFVYDPAVGPDLATRFDITDNPQVSADWPAHGLSYEDQALQRIDEEVRFTQVDFAACDPRYARYCEPTPRASWRDDMMPAADYLKLTPEQSVEHRAYVLTVDAGNALYRTVVDDKLIDAARHCADAWQRLQEMGGINNSHANRLLASERAAWEAQRAQELDEPRTAAPSAPSGAEAARPAEAVAPPVATVAVAVEPAEAEEPEAADPDEAWIETVRCTTCNECTQINNKMFVYDENMQAYIADLDAGTYRQMVEAAESCQVSIIHPGKPRDPSEPNLADLKARAEPFI